MNYFPDNEPPELQEIRSQILRYRSSDLMNDRERAAFFGLPEGCRMREYAKIINPERLKCGVNVWIGEWAVLDASGGLEIGDNSQVGVGVMVWSHTSHIQALRGETGSSKTGIVRNATRVGSNCFIAGPSVIAPGVTLGDRVVVSPMRPRRPRPPGGDGVQREPRVEALAGPRHRLGGAAGRGW
jgi:acetyltransferase-like isoleucine patch superfamily enzyme